MVHEQCRFDRDDYIDYRCHNLEGYESTLAAVMARGIPRAAAAKALCNNKAFATIYNFIGSQYVKLDSFPLVDGPDMDEGEFDYGSIMLYPSSARAADARCWSEDRTDLCPLVARQKDMKWRLISAPAPSRGDVAFVTRWYKWISGPPLSSASSSVSSGPPTLNADAGGERPSAEMAGRSIVRVHRIYR
ncbi:hypothetical protein BDW02DRAFT_601942 [Decorospora gaudefroyi]|uniref:Uncharacterized protein n=1 Tax=Decorospora gaudefroyi TaxID=184978 RepID=A0A6A5K6Q8_9PLEO|nr:hypothetical protein BDW02DRAFT_601942 [Decorospora gaudefroyi]